MPRLFGRRFPIQLRNQKGEVVASVQRGQDTLRIVTGSSPVDLRPLEGLEGLRHVELTGGSKWGINAPGAILPTSLPDLRALIVRGKIANQEVVPTFKRLETLWTGAFTTWPDIAWVRELVDLEHLHLRLGHKVADVTAVADLPRLRKLGLEGAYWADLAPVGRQTNLIELVLDYPRKGLHHLKRLTNLERLDLLELQSKHLNMVAGMTKLRELRVLGGAADISGLKDLRQLELLMLRRTRIDNAALANVSVLVNLHELSLMHVSRVTDISPIRHLSQLKNLNLFEMTGPLKSLRPLADCTELESLDAGLTEVDDQDLSFLYDLPRLKRVSATVYSASQKEEVERRLSQCQLTLRVVPGDEARISRGNVKIWKPSEGHPDFYISQDLTELLNVPEQAMAESKIARAFASSHPDLASQITYDSEGSAFVALSRNSEAIDALADTINSLATGQH